MNWSDRLDCLVKEVGNPCLLGIDPHLDLLPEEFEGARDPKRSRAERADCLRDFCRELINLAEGRVAAVKPQSAFFEVFGADGIRAWEDVVAHAHSKGLLVIGDVKRSDISSTALAYATAMLEGVPGTPPETLCDAITVNPYLGGDSIQPFLDVCARTEKGIYVLVRTSNPGGGDLQLHGDPPVSHRVAEMVAAMGTDFLGGAGLSSVGAVVGATHRAELKDFRRMMPHTPLLLPGYGAQGASAEDVRSAFPDAEHPFRGALVNSSRGIAFAWCRPGYEGMPWRDASRKALDAMIEELSQTLTRTR